MARRSWRSASVVALSTFALYFCLESKMWALQERGGIPSGRLGTDPASGADSAISRDIGRSGERGGASGDAKISLPRGVESPQPELFAIRSPRALATTADLLEQKLGIAVGYEDPMWISDNDLIRAADYPGNITATLQAPAWRGPLIPRGGILDVLIPESLEARKGLNAGAFISNVVENYRVHRNPGEFRVVDLGDDQFSIVPVRVEDRMGSLSSQNALLDARISLPELDRTASGTLDVIYGAISAATGIPLNRASDSAVYFDSHRVRLGAQNEVARNVLVRALRLPRGVKVSWRLYFDPERKQYAINLHGVMAEVRTSTGLKLGNVYWPN